MMSQLLILRPLNHHIPQGDLQFFVHCCLSFFFVFFFLKVNNSPLEIKGSDRAKELLIFDNQWVLSLFCFRTAGTGKAMKLGSKSKDVDNFVDKLRSEGTGEERSTTK